MKTIKKTVVNPATLASDIVKASSNVPAPKPEPKKADKVCYKPLWTTPSKKLELFSYTESILQFFGMRDIKRQAVSAKAFKAFGGMARALSYHGKIHGRFEEKNGLVRLTSDGLTFFTKRVDQGNTYKQDVIATMAKAYKAGKPSQAKDSIFKGIKFSKITY